MATPDFSKIFSTNSPSTPFTWSDSDYLEGWHSIAMTPPSRQQFDALQMISDEKAKYLYEYKAPKHSPVFTGDPVAPTPSWSDNDTSIATTAFVKHWISSVSQDLNDNGTGVTDDDITGNGYAKFKNGLIIQWGSIQLSSSATPITLPTSFSNTGWTITGSHFTINGTPTCVVFDGNGKTRNSCKVGMWNLRDNEWISIGDVYYIAIGY